MSFQAALKVEQCDTAATTICYHRVPNRTRAGRRNCIFEASVVGLSVLLIAVAMGTGILLLSDGYNHDNSVYGSAVQMYGVHRTNPEPALSGQLWS